MSIYDTILPSVNIFFYFKENIIHYNTLKVLPFHIIKTENASLHVQTDKAAYFYDILHRHPEIQITLIIKSKGTLILTDYMGDFGEEDLFIIGPNQPHVFKSDPEYYAPHSRLEAHSISIFFDKAMFGQAFLSLPENKKLQAFINKCAGNLCIRHKNTQLLGSKICMLQNKTGPQRLLGLLEILHELASSKAINFLSHTQFQKYQNDPEGMRMSKIIDYTTNAFHRTIDLDTIASISNMTTTSFCRYFKKRTRKTYTRFLIEVRIRQACKLLQGTDHPISQICFQTGFNNLSNFNRHFKKIMGSSPRKFRAIMKS